MTTAAYEVMICAVLLTAFVLPLLLCHLHQPGYDHMRQLNWVRMIKANGNRFIHTVDNVIECKDMNYPQLLHWMLSLFPFLWVKKYYCIFMACVNVVNIVIYMMFLQGVHNQGWIEYSLHSFIFWGLIIYQTTPFLYYIWNSKNSGLSARGFGLSIAHAYTYLVVLYICDPSYLMFGALCVCALTALMGSIFSFQFVLFTALPISFFCDHWELALLPPIGIVIFILIMPRVAMTYLRKQLDHKRIYYKYYAKVSILDYRFSIWRDLVYDIWIKKFPSLKERGYYIYKNPLITLVIGFPVLTGYMVNIFINNNEVMNRGVMALNSVVLGAFVVFIATSFRLTRFLGEPERYIEMVIPILSVIGLILLPQSYLTVIVAAGIIYTLMNLIFTVKMIGEYDTFNQGVDELVEFVKSKHNIQHRVFANNLHILPCFFDSNSDVLLPVPSFEYVFGYHITDVFPQQGGIIGENVLVPLSREAKINLFIYDRNRMTFSSETIKQLASLFEKIEEVNERFIVYSTD